MTQQTVRFSGGPIFDGHNLLHGHAAVFENGILSRLEPDGDSSMPKTETVDLSGDILSPGYFDLQVNGGDGVMLGDDPSLATIERITKAHRRLGALNILPTLITDTPEKTALTLQAGIEAACANTPGFAGLHLEGPHLSAVRKGAHDAALIRPMTDADVSQLIRARPLLPALKVTVAPENVTPEQVTQLVNAQILVSLGHTDAGFDTCLTYAEAGARCVTHLFNAMSPLGNREPGVVGAVLACGTLSSGLIADAIHVHPETMRAALKAKTGPASIFLVSDAMAVAGTELKAFELEGRKIHRNKGRLTLDDGTLAGADLDLTTALRVLTAQVGIPLPRALEMATTIPASMIGRSIHLKAGHSKLSDTIRIDSQLKRAQPIVDF